GRGGVWTTSCLTLFRDLVCPFARGVLGRLDLLPSLAAQDADEAAYGMRLPVRCFHDLRESRAFRALHHCDDLGFLVGAVRLRLGSCFLGAGGLLRGLGFLRFARTFWLRRLRRRLAVLPIDCVFGH